MVLTQIKECSCPQTKFHPNWTKNKEVKKISWLRLVGPVFKKIAAVTSNSFYQLESVAKISNLQYIDMLQCIGDTIH